ncbi:hypothetical protein [uncultured Aquimarina sp.]|uniref:tetratricopeptide repeat protein n=1 Tax=uncultured Aquimarina sp. TaxID=575652 RepID=UPI002604534F|nr:hypothetical protein [uncultured Aquimarina sp.]
MTKSLFLFAIACILYNSIIIAQTDKDKAQELLKEGIQLMDNGAIDESIEILKKGTKLYPDRIDFPYEIAYANYLKKEYKKAIKILEKLTDHKDVSDYIYQLLGNSYDYIKKPEKALETYQKGMKKFPKSGKFYLESGVIEALRKNYNEAIVFWEQGIKVEPNYPSNYYQLSKLFSNTDEKLWTLLYGEIFMNLEAGSKRTSEISKLLYDTYQESYEVLTDSSGQFNITKKGFEIIITDKKDMKDLKKGILPFAGTYASAYAFAGINFHSGIDIKSIYNARKSFLDFWFEQKKFHKQYPNKILSFQKEIQKEEIFEAYTYWLISEGNPEEFEKWYKESPEKFEKFATWFKSTSIDIKEKDLYSRRDY